MFLNKPVLKALALSSAWYSCWCK